MQTSKEKLVWQLMDGWGINPAITRTRLNRLRVEQLDNLFIRLSNVNVVNSYEATQEVLENFNWD